MHGDAPTLPESEYSEEAHAFVRACLDKNPNSRPTYAMLLRHPWLAPLMQPPTEDEAKKSAEESIPEEGSSSSVTEDKEVADWVNERLERLKSGPQESIDKPALHAAPLNAVSGSPLLEETNQVA